jgi:hypothetical protein
VLAQEPGPSGAGNPLDWYALPGPGADHLPSWLGLPAPPIPAPSYGPLLQASPLGRLQRLQPAPAVEIALFHPAPLGPLEPLERILDPKHRAVAALAFTAGPLAPAQRLEVAQSHPAPLLSPAPLGPAQAIQPFEGPGHPGTVAPEHPHPVADLTPHPLAPPQPLQAATPDGSLAGPAPTATGSVGRSRNVIRKGGVVVRAKN